MLADVSKPRTHTFIINNLKHFKVLSRMDFPVAMVTPSQVQSSSLLTLFRLATLQKKKYQSLTSGVGQLSSEPFSRCKDICTQWPLNLILNLKFVYIFFKYSVSQIKNRSCCINGKESHEGCWRRLLELNMSTEWYIHVYILCRSMEV